MAIAHEHNLNHIYFPMVNNDVRVYKNGTTRARMFLSMLQLRNPIFGECEASYM